MTSPPSFAFPLATPDLPLDPIGGKARALACTNLPVPHGFLISTRAYWSYVESNNLQGTIQSLIAELDPDSIDSAETVSAGIRALFELAFTASRRPRHVHS